MNVDDLSTSTLHIYDPICPIMFRRTPSSVLWVI